MSRRSRLRGESIAIFLCSLSILSMIAYVSIVPRPKEQFFQIYVLGENKMAEKYYPADNPNIARGVKVRWHLGATNFMGSLRYTVLRLKLANSTIPPPDDSNKLPSSAPVIGEFSRVLLDNETWEFPLTWSYDGVVARDDYRITSMTLNGRVLPASVLARQGRNYRIIIEIWTLDPLDEQVVFGWRSGNERKVAWLQVWFNATLPRPG